MRTRKPCPGCGEIAYNRPANEVCSTCKRKLTVIIPALEKALQNANAERDKVIFGSVYHWNRYYHCPTPINKKHFKDARKDNPSLLQIAIFELATAITIKDNEYTEKRFYPLGEEDSFHSYSAIYGTMPAGAAKAFRNLVDLLQPLINDAFQAGKEEGANLLFGLASGELSLKDFDKKLGK